MIDETGLMPIPGTAGPGLATDIEDEALATAARARYRTFGMVRIEPDGGMSAALWADEHLLAVRQAASVERPSRDARSAQSGRLAITTRRVLLVDAEPVTLASLEELDDVALVSDRLLVTLTSGTGFTIKVPHPRLLRVVLAEARASRLDAQVEASSKPASELPAEAPRR